MSSVKIAISVPKPLNDEAESAARKMHLSRSRFYALAMEECLERRRNRKLLERINEAYGDGLDAEEKKLLKGMRRGHKKMVEGEW